MNPYQNYFQNQIQTASREQILVMLYDGALRFLRQAREAMEERKRVVKLEKIGRVVSILSELSNTLNHEHGGEIAENLDGLYWYMIRELTRSNAQDDPKPLNVAEIILTDLRDGWAQAIEKMKSEQKNEDDAGPSEYEQAKPIHATG